MAEVDHERGEPAGASGRRGETEDLHISSDPRRSVELDAGLRHLPVAARTPLPAPHHGALVAEADRPRLVREPRRDHASDLRRHVGSQRRDFPRLGLDEAEHIRRIERTKPALEDLGELERWGRDELVAVQGEMREHAASERAATSRLFGQKIAHSCGERVRERPRRIRGAHAPLIA